MQTVNTDTAFSQPVELREVRVLGSRFHGEKPIAMRWLHTYVRLRQCKVAGVANLLESDGEVLMKSGSLGLVWMR